MLSKKAADFTTTTYQTNYSGLKEKARLRLWPRDIKVLA
jgi:hypothetical protein